jgi:hypothetical protein
LGYSNLGYSNLGYSNSGYSNLGYSNYGSAVAAQKQRVESGAPGRVAEVSQSKNNGIGKCKGNYSTRANRAKKAASFAHSG